MPDPTEQKLADWKAKTDAATEGPWEPVDAFSLTAPSQIDGFAFPMERQEDEWEIERNREFIATARTAVPRLLAAVEAARALHRPTQVGTRSMCRNCALPFPCATTRALDAALSGSEPDEGSGR